MIISVNPTGTHIHHDQLKVRLDLRPELGDKTWKDWHVYIPVWPEGGYPGEKDESGQPLDQTAYESWVKTLPHIWVTNPCLCLFVQVAPETTKAELVEYMGDVLTPDVIATIDDIMPRVDSIHRISPFMRGKHTLRKKIISPGDDHAAIIAEARQKFSALAVQQFPRGTTLDVEPESIAIGAPAEGRDSSWDIEYSTIVSKDGPADGTGTITTVEAWFDTVFGASHFWAGTFSANGNILTVRDSEDCEDTSAGSKQTFVGLTINVEADDYLGGNFVSAIGAYKIDADDDSGGLGVWYLSGEHIQTPESSETFDFLADWIISLQGTGEEVGGETHSGAATLSGVGTLAVSGIRARLGKATLSGVGALVAQGFLTAAGKVTLSGIGALVTKGYLTAQAKVTLSGVGTLAAIGTRVQQAKATLSGVGTLAVIGTTVVYHWGAATLSGVGTLAAKGFLTVSGKVTLVGVGALSTIGIRIQHGTATISGVGTLAVQGIRTRFGKVTLTGIGALAAIGTRIQQAQATLSGIGTLSSKGFLTAAGKAALSGVGTLATVGTRIRHGVVAFSGIGTLSAIITRIQEAKVSLSGVGTLAAAGNIITAIALALRLRSLAFSLLRRRGRLMSRLDETPFGDPSFDQNISGVVLTLRLRSLSLTLPRDR